MSKIAEQIQKLKEQEQRLHRETRKVEFLTHILDSAKEYEHEAFNDVKDDVTSLLENFVKKTIEAIEAGTHVTITVGAVTAPTANIAPTEPKVPEQAPVAQPTQLQPQKPTELSPAEKLNFALEHRNLAGKSVQVMNDKNLTITGSVVGLDAPFVLVKTPDGPVIKVPREKVILQ